ncbi:MAG: hypothetical protein ACI4DY_08940 [Monoglobaceae bacterium]
MRSKVIRHNGINKISIEENGKNKIIEPLSFKSFRPTKRNISEFYSAGVRLFSILTSGLNNFLGVPYSLYGESWIGENEYDFSVIDAQIDLFLENAPEGYFALMIQLDTREWFLEKHKDCPNSFYYLSQTACYDEWRRQAADYLKAVIIHTEEKYGDKMYGYFLLGGKTTEWFSYADHGEGNLHKERWYRKAIGDNSAEIPGKQERDHTENGIFRNPAVDQKAVNYWRLHNNLIADTVLYFAGEAQSVIKHKKLLGVYFGYLFDLLDTRLLEEGHLEFEKIFRSEDIDMISSPSSYYHRQHGDTSGLMVTLESLLKHNKLYYLEFDHITYISPPAVNGVEIPGGDSKLKCFQDTADVMRRDFMLCASRGAALWWFDMFEGWFYDKRLMNEIRKMVEIKERLSEIEQYSVSEIAVFAEGAPSMYYVNQYCGLNNYYLNAQLDGLARMGAPYDLYAIGDAEHLEKDYKLYIFLNQFKIDKSVKMFAKHILEEKKADILWMYAPNCILDGKELEEGISEITGMNVKALEVAGEKAIVMNEREEVKLYGDISPVFYVDDSETEQIAYYDRSRKTAVAVKKHGSSNVFYSGAGNLSAEILRNTAQRSGVHIYNFSSDPVYVSNRLIGVYSDTDGEITIRLRNASKAEELFEDERINEERDRIVFNTRKGEAKLFLLDREQGI